MSANNSTNENIPARILDFSSQYGSSRAQSYGVGKILQGVQVFPSYGDSVDALVFRTYGPWWLRSPAYNTVNSLPNYRFESHFTSRDYVEIEFQQSFDHRSYLRIYETYNPGTLETVYVGERCDDGRISWHRVWTFPEAFTILLRNGREILIPDGKQRKCDIFPDDPSDVEQNLTNLNLNQQTSRSFDIHTYHSFPPAARSPRITKISFTGKFSFSTKLIRLEFDHSTVDYYTEIDTVMIVPCDEPRNPLLAPKPIETSANEIIESENKFQSTVGILDLPLELLISIFALLDLRSLIRLSSTCKALRDYCLHPLNFVSLNLQPYWKEITNETIEQLSNTQFIQTRYLSLAWTKSISNFAFQKMLTSMSDCLIQLNLSCCQYLTQTHLEILVRLCPRLENLNLQMCNSLSADDFLPLVNCENLRALNVSHTNVNYKCLLPLIDRNHQHLEHLHLGDCQNLVDHLGIIRLVFGRCFNLKSLELWRAHRLQSNGFMTLTEGHCDLNAEEYRFDQMSENDRFEIIQIYSTVNMPIEIVTLSKMKQLNEIEFGWNPLPLGFIKAFVEQAGQNLIKIFLSGCRNTNSEDIIAIANHCSKLRQLDVLGSNRISHLAIDYLLTKCSHLEYLDLSFCSSISEANVLSWKSRYSCSFKRSYTPIQNDNPYFEFP